LSVCLFSFLVILHFISPLILFISHITTNAICPRIHLFLPLKYFLSTAPPNITQYPNSPCPPTPVTYKSFTLSIVYVVDRVYVIKAMNLEDNEGEGEMQQQME
jgi:hypothetical protein